MIETKQKYTFKIEQSEDYASPREWDNVSKFAVFHSRYDSPNDSYLERRDIDELGSWDCVREELIRCHDIYPFCIKPVYMYDHGGITLSTTGFSCSWDSGQVGFVFVDKATIKKESITRVQAIDCLDSEFNTYDQYLRGDVWDVFICDDSDNVAESVCGFYGHEYAEAEAEAMVSRFENKG